MKLKVLFGAFTLITIGLLIYLSSLFIQLKQIMLVTTSDATTIDAIHTSIGVNVIKMLTTLFLVYLLLLVMYSDYQAHKKKQEGIRKLNDFADALFNKSKECSINKQTVSERTNTNINPDDVLNYAENVEPKDIVVDAHDLERRVEEAKANKPNREEYISTQAYGDDYYQWIKGLDKDVAKYLDVPAFKGVREDNV